jgi:hypothetical protein
MNHEDIEFLRSLPAEVIEKLVDVTEGKLARLREIHTIVKVVGQQVREAFQKLNDHNRELTDEITALKTRVSQLEALTVRDLEQR